MSRGKLELGEGPSAIAIASQQRQASLFVYSVAQAATNIDIAKHPHQRLEVYILPSQSQGTHFRVEKLCPSCRKTMAAVPTRCADRAR